MIAVFAHPASRLIFLLALITLTRCGQHEDEAAVLNQAGLLVTTGIESDDPQRRLLPGDLLQTWRYENRPAAPPRLLADVPEWAVTAYHAPAHAPLLLGVLRGEQHLEVLYDQSSGNIQVQAPLPKRLQARFLKAEGLRADNDLAAAVAAHRELLEELRLYPGHTRWLLHHIAEIQEKGRLNEDAVVTLNQLLKKTENPAVRGRIANRLGVLHLRLKQLEKAEALFIEAEQAHQKSPFAGLGEIRYQHYLGHLARMQRDWVKAQQHWEKAAHMLTEIAPQSTFLAAIYIDLGVAAKNRNQYDAADGYYGRSAALYAAVTPNATKRANALYNRGSLARLQGRLVDAEAFQKASLEILEKHPNQPAEKMFRRYTQLVFISMDRKNSEAVAHAAVEALRWAEQVAEKSAVVELLNGLGAFYAEEGDLESAKSYLETALQNLAGLDDEKSTFYRALAKNNLGYVHLNAGKLDAAQQELDAALTDLEAGSGYHAYNLRLQSEVARKQGAPQRGLKLLQTALDVLPDDTTSGFDRASLLGEKARCLMDLNDLKTAETAWEAAAQAYEKQLDALGGNQFVQANFFLSAADSYRNLVRLRAERGDLEGAFGANERFRGPVLRRLFNGLGRGSGVRALQVLRDQQWLEVEEIRKRLDPGTLLISFCVLEKETLAFALDRRNGLTMTALPKAGRRALSRQVEDYRKALRSVKPNTVKDIQKRGQRLYRMLLQPLEQRIHQAERLVVCPDGRLSVLPFAALVRAGEPVASWEEIPFLAKEQPIHVALSGTFYIDDLSRRKTRTDWAQNARVEAFARPDHAPSLDLPDLPGSAREAAELAERFPDRTTVHEGRAANEDQVRAVAADVDLIHFAGHALFDPEDAMNSALILTPSNKHDGKLATWEIQELNLGAELVVMSACETALGHDMGGEGLMGLTRSFHIAGAHSVVATLWRVEDQATSLFMNHFYAALSRGDNKDKALRFAQNSMIDHPRWGHPNYWAAFQLSGDWY
ncbi:CHAT domain-containing protein [Acanthopleuribacter pedis]|uniref:CHAT domain-containing protein n=1 Tax=Acanthopleuribacter pedis TaxID=442870 RepID=A0A8J7QV67_9BACT|nr:CHAT domain-containing protein [Acanthopleuribacter pedis]MBO1323453.1 CHAT domain-containing protein [Acanthopleuribacter pedis]